MKHLLCLVAMICLYNGMNAQDTIYFKNGEFVIGKVFEIGPNDIKYKKAQIPDGPIYVSYKSDVTLIQYSNGYKEAFTNNMTNLPLIPQPVNAAPPVQEASKVAKEPMQPELKYYPYGVHHYQKRKATAMPE